ncbi:hypothetical protein D9M69_627180 [compost metagenome]
MSMPLAALKAGSSCENRPDCSVEVVEAMVMVSALTGAMASAAARPVNVTLYRRVVSGFIGCVLLSGTDLQFQAAGH